MKLFKRGDAILGTLFKMVFLEISDTRLSMIERMIEHNFFKY